MFWGLCLHHLATVRHCWRSPLMAVLFLQHLLREQTGHHLPEGGNSFHWAEQAKQTLLNVWSLQGSKGHGALWSFPAASKMWHWYPTNPQKSHLGCDSDAFMESLSGCRQPFLMPVAGMTPSVYLTHPRPKILSWGWDCFINIWSLQNECGWKEHAVLKNKNTIWVHSKLNTQYGFQM